MLKLKSCLINSRQTAILFSLYLFTWQSETSLCLFTLLWILARSLQSNAEEDMKVKGGRNCPPYLIRTIWTPRLPFVPNDQKLLSLSTDINSLQSTSRPICNTSRAIACIHPSCRHSRDTQCF